jgi:TPP-dependent pyruvate/acetoin dehydrogenase alpha subunit
MLFVSHSNLATGPVIGEVQSRRKANDLKAQQYGIPSIPVDSSDAVAVYRVATEAMAHARKGNGATLIDCVTFSLDGNIDPIAKMEAYLSRKGLFREALRREVAAGFTRELDAAVEEKSKGAFSA